MITLSNDAFSSGSPLSGLLGVAPKTVSPPPPPPVEPEPVEIHETPPPTQNPSLLGGLFQSNQPPEPERLTADEIRARAEVQTRTYGAVILLFNALIECVKVSLTMKKGDYKHYLDLKADYEQNRKDGVTVMYEVDPELREIWDKGQKFEQTLEAIEAENELDDSESKLLFKAIKADLERKNRKNELTDDSVAGTIMKLLLTRQLTSAFELITLFTKRKAQS